MIDIAFNWSDLIVILLTFACFGTLSGLLLFLKDRFLTPKSRPGRNSRRTAPCVPQVAEKIPAELVKNGRGPVLRSAAPTVLCPQRSRHQIGLMAFSWRGRRNLPSFGSTDNRGRVVRGDVVVKATRMLASPGPHGGSGRNASKGFPIVPRLDQDAENS